MPGCMPSFSCSPTLTDSCSSVLIAPELALHPLTIVLCHQQSPDRRSLLLDDVYFSFLTQIPVLLPYPLVLALLQINMGHTCDDVEQVCFSIWCDENSGDCIQFFTREKFSNEAERDVPYLSQLLHLVGHVSGSS